MYLYSSRSKMFQVEDAAYRGQKPYCLCRSFWISLLITMTVCAISKGFLSVSLVNNWVSLEVFSCWLNLVASCLGDENEVPLRVIIVLLHGLNEISPLFSVCVYRFCSGRHNLVLSVQAR